MPKGYPSKACLVSRATVARLPEAFARDLSERYPHLNHRAHFAQTIDMAALTKGQVLIRHMTRAPVILAATDGTERSQAVLGRAALIARDWGARLALVHVRKAGAARFRLRLARTSRHELAQELAAHGGDAAALHMLEGAPAERIAALVARLQPALLVMGLHRERRVLDVLRMTTMERITLAVTCPVLIAKTMPPRPYARVLAALSFDPVCTGGVALAARVAPDARFHAIHALPMPLPDTPAAARPNTARGGTVAGPLHVRPRPAAENDAPRNRARGRARGAALPYGRRADRSAGHRKPIRGATRHAWAITRAT